MLYAEQRRFLAGLEATDPRISVHMGRLEQRPVESPASEAILGYLANLSVRIDTAVFHDLVRIAREHQRGITLVEKAVDVMIAVDMVIMAVTDELDAVYLLSADGDFTPAVKAVRGLGKKVYVVSPQPGAQLASAANASIPLARGWVSGLLPLRCPPRRGHVVRADLTEPTLFALLLRQNAAQGLVEDLVPACADAGEGGLDLDVGDDADALGRAFVGVEDADAR
ncbi:MAG: NYN domain-containing protein [Thermoanaerobaculaceae bacterium]